MTTKLGFWKRDTNKAVSQAPCYAPSMMMSVVEGAATSSKYASSKSLSNKLAKELHKYKR
jgi:hypothetical protein